MVKRKIFIFMFVLLMSLSLANSNDTKSNLEDMFDYSYLLVPLAVKPSVAGTLRVIEHEGIKTIGDQNGNVIQLRGMSTHGLQWYPEILNGMLLLPFQTIGELMSFDWLCMLVKMDTQKIPQ